MRVRVTVACPEAHRDDANDLAMVLATGPADGRTYAAAQWKDALGNLYSCVSFPVRPEWLTAAQSTLVRPSWDVHPYVVNMAGAERAQALLSVWQGVGEVVQAAPTAMATVVGMDALDAIAAMGLAMYEP